MSYVIKSGKEYWRGHGHDSGWIASQRAAKRFSSPEEARDVLGPNRRIVKLSPRKSRPFREDAEVYWYIRHQTEGAVGFHPVTGAWLTRDGANLSEVTHFYTRQAVERMLQNLFRLRNKAFCRLFRIVEVTMTRRRRKKAA